MKNAPYGMNYHKGIFVFNKISDKTGNMKRQINYRQKFVLR